MIIAKLIENYKHSCMKSLIIAMLLGLMMVGCGEDAQEETVQEDAVQKEAKDESAAPFGDNFTVPVLNLTMIWVKPGTFMMGSPESEAGRLWGASGRRRQSDEVQHEVTHTKGFYLGKYEVTLAKWKKVMGNNPNRFKGADRPVETVEYWSVIEFCKKLTEMEKKAGRVPEGMAYQLPTEAQWEYACRAGTTTAYSWGTTIAAANAAYNYDPKETTPVGRYPANPWGFHDMHGNVSEWCADWYGPYPIGSVTNPEGPASGSHRVYRGGCWSAMGSACRSAVRYSRRPGYRGNPIPFSSAHEGFRISLRAVTK